MTKLTTSTGKAWRISLLLLLALLTHQTSFAQSIMFDDFTYTGVTDLTNRANASIKWNVIDGESGPPDGAIYSKNNIEFVTDPDNVNNKFLRVSTTANGQTRAVTHSRIETDGFEYFEGTYASRVYLSDEATGTGDGNNQTYFTIVSSDLASDGSKYSEMDIVEYLASDKWGLNPDKPALYTTSYNKYIADPWKAWKTYVVQKKSYGGWHIFMAVCTDKVNIRYYIDGVLISTQSVTDSESQAGLPVYPRSPMQIAYANWIVDNDLGPSTANRTNTMQVDWTLHYTNTALSYDQVNALVAGYRSSGLQRRNLAGQTLITGTTNQAPQVQLTAPANNATYTSPASIAVTANASDADGTISKVEFFNGTTSLGVDATSPYAVSWTNVAAGTYTITAKATDNSNAVTTSSAVTVVISNPVNKAPTVSITSPANNASFTAPATISVTANASDADGTISKVEFFNGTNSLGVDASSPYAVSWTNVATGTYNITAKATDNNNAVTTSAAVTVVVNPISTTGPVVAYQNCNNDPGYSIGLQVGTYTTAQLVALGIKDNDVSRLMVQSGYVVTLYNNDNLDASGTTYTTSTDASCLTSVNFNDLTSSIKIALVNTNPQTPYGGTPASIPGTVQAENYDLGGQDIAFNDVTAANEGGAYRTDAVDVEPFSGGYDVGYIVNGEWLEYTVNVTAGTYKIDANVAAIAAGKTFSLQLDGTTIASFTVPNTGAWGTFQLTTVNNVVLSAGQKILRISATSTDFNIDKLVFTAATTTVNQSPVVNLTSPSNNASIAAPASIAIAATASDADGTINKVDFYNGTTLLGTDATSPYTYTWTNVAAGNYNITAKATDNANAVTTSSMITLTVTAVVTSNTCSGIALYVETGGYAAGSKVQNSGSQYQCKPYPYSGWCNGAAWAYAPGTGAYWSDAWTLLGTCSASARMSDAATVNDALLINLPNPFSATTTIQLETMEAGEVLVTLYNKTGQALKEISSGYLSAGTHQFILDASDLKADVYLIKCTTSSGVVTRKIVKTE